MRRALFVAAWLFGCGSSSEAPRATDASADTTTSDGGIDAGTWRSALYPTDWAPGFATSDGASLHDFSYAGYHHGEAAPAAPPGSLVVDVVNDMGADASGVTDATAKVQSAIAKVQAAGAGVVYFPAGLYRFDGTLAIAQGHVVLRGEGAEKSRLYFTKSSGLSFQSHITFRPKITVDRVTPLAADAAPMSDSVIVADAGDLAVGDDLQLGHVITPEFVADHGMTGVWSAFNGTWQPLAHRRVVALAAVPAGVRVTLDVPLRSPLLVRDKATLQRVRGLAREVGVEHLGLANAVAWSEAWAASQVHVLEFDDVADGWIHDVASFSPPTAPASGQGAGSHLQSCGLLLLRDKSITVSDVRLSNAENRGGGGNGYLFEIRQSNEILTKDSVGDRGRHAFIQNWGFGTAGCVWLRVHSQNGDNVVSQSVDLGLPALSEFHHSLATANLFDDSTFDDGLQCVNRGLESTGAGHAGTENVFWNVHGAGAVRSLQWRRGYVVGTRDVRPLVELVGPEADGTEPRDWLEGQDQGATLAPQSLYEDQLARRKASARPRGQ